MRIEFLKNLIDVMENSLDGFTAELTKHYDEITEEVEHCTIDIKIDDILVVPVIFNLDEDGCTIADSYLRGAFYTASAIRAGGG